MKENSGVLHQKYLTYFSSSITKDQSNIYYNTICKHKHDLIIKINIMIFPIDNSCRYPRQ